MIGRVATSVVVQDNPLRDVEWATEQNVRRPIASHERYTKTLERVAANDGGLTGKADISPEMGPVAHSWLTRGPTGVRLSMGGTGFEPVTSWV